MAKQILASALLGSACASLMCGAAAQSAAPKVHWALQVVLDGQNVDAFTDTTAVGQSQTFTHRHAVEHPIGCGPARGAAQAPTASIELSRTVTITPESAGNGTTLLAIDAHEILEESAARTTSEGCALPPQPRQVDAQHPGLTLSDGKWTEWPILTKDPSLIYRVQASPGPP